MCNIQLSLHETTVAASSEEHRSTSSLRRESRTISEAICDLDRLSAVVPRVLVQSAAEAWGKVHGHTVRLNTRLAARRSVLVGNFVAAVPDAGKAILVTG
jgi:hypothetical protein